MADQMTKAEAIAVLEVFILDASESVGGPSYESVDKAREVLRHLEASLTAAQQRIQALEAELQRVTQKCDGLKADIDMLREQQAAIDKVIGTPYGWDGLPLVERVVLLRRQLALDESRCQAWEAEAVASYKRATTAEAALKEEREQQAQREHVMVDYIAILEASQDGYYRVEETPECAAYRATRPAEQEKQA